MIFTGRQPVSSVVCATIGYSQQPEMKEGRCLLAIRARSRSLDLMRAAQLAAAAAAMTAGIGVDADESRG